MAGAYDSFLQTISIFVDGELVSSTTSGTIPSSIGDDAGRFQIGSEDSTTTALNFYDGVIDEVRVYNKPFTQSDARSLFDFGTTPIGYWGMDDGADAVSAQDKSGGAHHATVTIGASGTQTITAESWINGKPGKYGGGINLDGTDDFLSVADTLSNTMSVSFWVYPRSTSENLLSLNGSAYISASSGTLSATGFTSPIIYVDGVLTSTISANRWQFITVTTSTGISGSTIYFGRVASNYLNGKLDEVRMYNYVRTPKQIVEDMNAGHATVGSPVGSALVHLKMEEGQGTTLNNSGSDTTLTGTLSNAASPATSVSGWSYSGRVGRGLVLDGSDDVLTLTNKTSIDLNDNLAAGFSISTWISPESDGEGDLGQVFQKGTTTYLRVSNQDGSGNLDLEGSLALGTSNATVTVSDAFLINTWNHVSLVYTDDLDDEITLFVNGKSMGTSTNGSGGPAADTNNLLLGGTTTANFDGRIDEFKIYSSELSPDEVEID